MAEATIERTVARDGLRLRAAGRWTIRRIAALDAELRRLPDALARDEGDVAFDLEGVERMDTAGAWLLERTRRALSGQGREVALEGGDPSWHALLDRLAAIDQAEDERPEGLSPLLRPLERVGRAALSFLDGCLGLLAFFGAVCASFGRVALRPWRLRLTALVSHMQDVGLNALPIVGLLAFLVGVVLAFQGAAQLARFQAEIFTVNLVGLSVLREVGVLLTAILVAGRSGSAFTAQIGTMKVNEETDAIETLGLDPIEVLVLPRLIAIVLVMPLLTFFADMMGLFAGGVVLVLMIDLTFQQFGTLLLGAVEPVNFWLGLIKAPVFGFLIGMVGCHQGLLVERSAESVGRLTTRSVVLSIFLVIVVDALFSVLTADVGL